MYISLSIFPVDSDRRLHNSQIGSEMPAGIGYMANQKIADFLAKSFGLLFIQLYQIISATNIFQNAQNRISVPMKMKYVFCIFYHKRCKYTRITCIFTGLEQ